MGHHFAAAVQLERADAAGVRRRGGGARSRRGRILAALRAVVDPVFLPRPLRRIDALPRSATGKLPRAALLELPGSWSPQCRRFAGTRQAAEAPGLDRYRYAPFDTALDEAEQPALSSGFGYRRISGSTSR